MSTTTSQLETGIKLHETWRHSAADGASIHGDRLDVIYWQVSDDIILRSTLLWTVNWC